jgi:hypothetical protein
MKGYREYIFPNQIRPVLQLQLLKHKLENESETARVGFQVLSCPVSSNPHNLTFHWFFNSTPEFKAGKY